MTTPPHEPINDVPEAETIAAPVEPGTELVPVAKPEPGPGVLDLVLRSARLGVDAATLMAGEVADFSLRVVRSVVPPAIGARPLGALDSRLTERQNAAREREEQSVEVTREAAESVLNQAVVGVVDMLDMERLIDHIPVDKVVARVDVAAVISEVDLGGIVRESTTGLAGETVDAIRVQVMGLDLFAARVVDRIFRRKQPRDLHLLGYDAFGSEMRIPKDMQ
jgi:hypothetical protein